MIVILHCQANVCTEMYLCSCPTPYQRYSLFCCSTDVDLDANISFSFYQQGRRISRHFGQYQRQWREKMTTTNSGHWRNTLYRLFVDSLFVGLLMRRRFCFYNYIYPNWGLIKIAAVSDMLPFRPYLIIAPWLHVNTLTLNLHITFLIFE